MQYPDESQTTPSQHDKIRSSSLQESSDIVILTPNKGSATVLMNQSEYTEKIEDLPMDPVYRKIMREPTSATERKITRELKKLEQEGHITKTLMNRLKPTASRPCKLYGLLKIHKSNVPL